MAGPPLGRVFTPQHGIQDPCRLFWPHLYPFPTTPHTTSRHCSVWGSEDHLWESWLDMSARRVDVYLVDMQLPAHLNPLRLYKGNGWPGGPETPTPHSYLQVPGASAEPPRGPQVQALLSSFPSTFTSWSSYSRETMPAGPALGKLPGWKSRNDPVT